MDKINTPLATNSAQNRITVLELPVLTNSFESKYSFSLKFLSIFQTRPNERSDNLRIPGNDVGLKDDSHKGYYVRYSQYWKARRQIGSQDG